MAVAWLHSDDAIREQACPADIGGFVVPIVEDFHKVFANAGGTYIEYETNGDLRYNPTGLIRCHVKGCNPQLGPSDGVVHKFDPKTKQDQGGENLCVGPAWQDNTGTWFRLADVQSSTPPRVHILEEKPDRVRFRVEYSQLPGGATRITQTLTLESSGITIEDRVEGEGLKQMRVYYPMLVFDGLEETKVDLVGESVRLQLREGPVRFTVLEPAGVKLTRSGVRRDQRNGQMEACFADIEGLRATYRIEASPSRE